MRDDDAKTPWPRCNKMKKTPFSRWCHVLKLPGQNPSVCFYPTTLRLQHLIKKGKTKRIRENRQNRLLLRHPDSLVICFLLDTSTLTLAESQFGYRVFFSHMLVTEASICNLVVTAPFFKIGI